MQQLWQGTLRKMRAEAGEPVQYWLADGHHDPGARHDELALNPLLGQRLTLRFEGAIHCVFCGRATRKSFGDGFCYPCFQARAEADICMVRPERCHYFEPADPCRDEGFAQQHCFAPHILYASLTSGTKVGITRQANVPTRWIDQGAVAAVPLAKLPSRREVGLLEHRLAEQIADKTHWMRMLKNAEPEGDLAATVAQIVSRCEEWGVEDLLPVEQRVEQRFQYPVEVYPTKVKSHNLDKNAVVEGVLQGIKGQYWLLDSGVINLRKFTGYQVSLSG